MLKLILWLIALAVLIGFMGYVFYLIAKGFRNAKERNTKIYDEYMMYCTCDRPTPRGGEFEYCANCNRKFHPEAKKGFN